MSTGPRDGRQAPPAGGTTRAEAHAAGDSVVHGDAAAPVALQPGAVLGDLELVRELGRGAQGVVFEARQRSMGRRVAVKILDAGATLVPEMLERFRREAAAAGRLNHPHVVTVHGLERAGGHWVLVQEFVDGESLEDLVEGRRWEGRRTDAEGCRWAAALCRHLAEALAHAHEHGVVHRDVKPSNVFVTRDGAPKLGDFGLARLDDGMRLSLTGSILGTPHYMSPEQVDPRSAGELDGRTDVYSLGAVLYRLLTGEVPFRGKTLQALFNDIVSREPRSPRALQPGVDRDLEAVALKCLEKSPQGRYATAGELAADLGRYLEGRSTLARPVGPLGRTNRALRRLAKSTLLLVVLLVPALWFALDAAWLRPRALRDVELHDARIGAVAAAALLAAWPAALLAQRLARGRRWAVAPALVLVALVGGGGAWSATETAREHALIVEQTADRERLEERIAADSVAIPRELERYIDRWRDRFAPVDLFLVARAWLEAHRAPRAREWVDRMAAIDPGSPRYLALDYVLADLFESEDERAAAEARLWQAAERGGSWIEWQDVALILRDIRRYDLARRACAAALRDPRVEIHRVTPVRAQLALDECRADEAEAALRVTLDAAPANPSVRSSLERLQCLIAIAEGRWEQAAGHIAAYGELPGADRLTALGMQYRLLAGQGEAAAIRALLDGIAQADEPTAAELQWCGGVAATSAIAQSAEDLAALLDIAQGCFERLLAMDPSSVAAHVGLASVALAQANPQLGASPERQDELLARAEEFATDAIALDDTYYEAWYSLATARFERVARQYGGDFGAMPLEVLDSFTEPLRRALDCHGTEPLVLNNFAQAVGLVFEKQREREPALLAEGLACIRRAIRLATPSEQSLCGPDPRLAVLHDTRRHLLELAERKQEALHAARLAVESLPLLETADPQAAAFHAPMFRDAVARLEEEVGGKLH